MSVNNNSFDQNVQNALQAIEQRYKDLQSWIAQMQADNEAINSDAQKLKTEIYDEHGWWIFTYTTVNTGLENQLNDDIAAKQADLSQLADKVAAANKDGAFNSLVAAIKACLSGETEVETDQGENTENDGERLADDLMQISLYINQLLSALQQKVVVQEEQDEIQQLSANDDGSNPQTSNLIAAMVEKLIGDESKESTILDNLSSTMDNTDIQKYNKEYNDADTDENGIHWWDYLNPFEDASGRKYNDEQIKKNAMDMMALIGKIQSAFSPELASLMPDFVEISTTLDQIVKKLEELLSQNLSPGQQQALLQSLNQQIMNLFVLVMGILGIVQEDTTKDKAKNEAKMSESTTTASQLGIANSQAQAKKIQQDLDYASIMGSLMDVCKYVLMAVGAVAVPGIGSMLIGMMLIMLQASGLLDKATNALASKMGQLGAEIFMGGLEMVATMGGGAVLDAALKSAMENVMRIVAETVATTVAKSIASASAKVAESMGQEAAAAMEPVIEQTVQNAMETAEKKAFTMFFSKNGLGLAIDWLKSVASGGFGAAERMVQSAMVKAAEEAADTAAQEASKLVILLGKKSAAELTQSETALFTELSQEVGNKAAAAVMNATLKQAEKLTVIGENQAKDAAWRGGFTALYAVGSNNMLVDAAEFFQKKYHMMSDDEFDKLKLALQAIQALLMAIAQMVGSGAAAQFMNAGQSEAMQMFQKISNAAQLVATTGEAAASYGQYEVDKGEADATTQMGKIQTALDVLLQMLAPWIENRRRNESKSDNQKFVQEMQSTATVAGHIHDYLNTTAQVIIAG